MKKKFNFLTLIIYVALIVLLIVGTISLFNANKKSESISYSEMKAYFESNNVYGYESNINKYVVTIYLSQEAWDAYHSDKATADQLQEHKDKVKTAQLTSEEYYRFFNPHDAYELSELAKIQRDISLSGQESILKQETHTKLKETSKIFDYLPIVILIIAFVLIMFFVMRQQGGNKMGGFGKSKAVKDSTDKRVTFEDVAGADEEKEELQEVVEYLKNPAKFTHLGAKIPHGVLLVGPPGTGKTLLAKAVAGEAGVPFYSMSGSDFVELYVGVGASRVRDLFDQARKSHSAIIFIDEIDAVGRQRGAGLGGGHDEREQTLNQLLVEMDGFGGHSGIIVMAATNRPDILDSALLRPGRFDRQITIGYPDLAGREAILNVHAKGKPFEETVDFHKIAQTTVGFTGADLANLLNESALLAARKGKQLIGMTEIEDAMIKVTVGTQKKARRMSEKERRNTAAHEAGHAILSHVLPTQDPVRQISIIPSGRALGYTLTPPTEDKYSESKQELKETIAMMLGGRVAEQLVFGDYTGGASNDIMRATEIARKMVTVYGMSDELGTIHFGSQHGADEVFLGRDFSSTPSYSDATASRIDAEIKKIIDEAYALATSVITEKREKLDFVTEFLLRNEVMDDEQFALAMQDGVTMEEVEALVTEKKRRSEEENKRRAQKLEQERRNAEEERKRLERELGLSDDEDEGEAPQLEGEQSQELGAENAEEITKPDGEEDVVIEADKEREATEQPNLENEAKDNEKTDDPQKGDKEDIDTADKE